MTHAHFKRFLSLIMYQVFSLIMLVAYAIMWLLQTLWPIERADARRGMSEPEMQPARRDDA
jgi:hypothetical protein